MLGGTFDPVHCAHLRLALEMRELLDLDTVRLMPAGSPRLRDAPTASPAARLSMLEAAIAGVPGLAVDDRELWREGETRTVDSLQGLRAALPGRSIVFLVGLDAFARLPEWHRWETLTELAHLAVAGRPGAALPVDGPVADFLRERAVDDPAALAARPAGHVIVRDITALDISASRIRALIGSGRSVRFLVPDAVHEHITRENPYPNGQ